jgi:hypothetical protein
MKSVFCELRSRYAQASFSVRCCPIIQLGKKSFLHESSLSCPNEETLVSGVLKRRKERQKTFLWNSHEEVNLMKQ